jgi:hypothetical protein
MSALHQVWLRGVVWDSRRDRWRKAEIRVTVNQDWNYEDSLCGRRLWRRFRGCRVVQWAGGLDSKE